MRFRIREVYILLCTLSSAKGFTVSPLAKIESSRKLAGRSSLFSLHMSKALQRPGQASSDAPSVALIGGGIAGLTCARRLKELGLSPTVCAVEDAGDVGN